MPKKDDKPLEGLVKDIVERLSGEGALTREDIHEAWEKAVGKKAAMHSRPVSLNRAVLAVNVDGSAWLYELTTRKRETIKKMQEMVKNKKLKDIRFRIGETK